MQTVIEISDVRFFRENVPDTPAAPQSPKGIPSNSAQAEPDSPFKLFSMPAGTHHFPRFQGTGIANRSLNVAVVLIRGINDDLPFFARAFAFAADAGLLLSKPDAGCAVRAMTWR